MRKALYLSAATVMLFAMIFAGCDTGVQESLNEQKQTYPSLSAPKNLKAYVQPGFIALSWDPVKDATSGYVVYRKDAVTGQTKNVTPGGTYYLDKVGYSNQLVDKRKYTYTVVALGRNVGGGSNAEVNLLLEGSAAIDATANVPAKGSEVIAAADAIKDISSRTIISGSQDYLEVTWTGNEYLTYSIHYYYGDGTVPIWYENWENASVGSGGIAGSVEKRQTIPLVGGDTTVKITARWDNEEWYKSAEQSKTVTGTATLLPNVGGFDVTSAATGIYTLKWNAVDGATGYDIWKAAVTGSITEDTAYQDGDQGYKAGWPTATLGAWTAVSGTPSRNVENDVDTYRLVETGVDTSKKWLYGIVAKNADAKSRTLTTRPVAALPQTINTTFAQSNIKETWAEDGKPQLTIAVNVADGETVALSRAKAEYTADKDGKAVLDSIGAYTPVTGGATIGALYTWIDAPTIRDSYAYKLTVTKGGLSAETVEIKKNEAYTRFFNDVEVIAEPSLTSAYSINIKLGGTLPYAYYTDDLQADIYQATADSGGNARSEWAKITDTPQTYKTLSTTGFTKTQLAPDTYYIYRVKLTSTANTSAVLYAPDQSDNGKRPSVVTAPNSYIWNYGTGTSNYSVYTSSDVAPGNPLAGAKVFVLEEVTVNTTTTYEPTGVSAFLNKAGSSANDDPYAPANSHFAGFTKGTLNGLNSTATQKTYWLAVEDNDGVYTRITNNDSSFTVQNGAVTGW